MIAKNISVMVQKNKIIFRILTAVVLILAASFFLGGKGILSQLGSRQTEYAFQSGPQLFVPNIDGLLPAADMVSLAEARARFPFTVSLPEGFEVLETWVSRQGVKSQDRSIAFRFRGDLELIIHQMEEPPDWDGIVASTPGFSKITVNGHPGMGKSPGEYRTAVDNYEKVYISPGSVSWWVDDLWITLYSNTFTMEALLKIAESMAY